MLTFQSRYSNLFVVTRENDKEPNRSVMPSVGVGLQDGCLMVTDDGHCCPLFSGIGTRSVNRNVSVHHRRSPEGKVLCCLVFSCLPEGKLGLPTVSIHLTRPIVCSSRHKVVRTMHARQRRLHLPPRTEWNGIL
ncbi:hypothetical protein J6590_030765 [Homalodisca vitripennis]|nr:hypothetical protein J6590_030765 [Homalodisca vitripennis]